MTDITTQFPLPWSVGSYGFDIKAANGLHVDEICSASDEDGDKQLAALICRAVNNHDALARAIEVVVSQFGEREHADCDCGACQAIRGARSALANAFRLEEVA